jgi:hypothetical protein
MEVAKIVITCREHLCGKLLVSFSKKVCNLTKYENDEHKAKRFNYLKLLFKGAHFDLILVNKT